MHPVQTVGADGLAAEIAYGTIRTRVIGCRSVLNSMVSSAASMSGKQTGTHPGHSRFTCIKISRHRS